MNSNIETMINKKIKINLINGLGDKLLDLIGIYIICKYLNYTPCVNFQNDVQYVWGNNTYDLKLFQVFDDIILLDSNNHTEIGDFYAFAPNPSSSTSPYRIYLFIRRFLPEITFQQISDDFITCAKKIIQPSNIIKQGIPNDIEHAYGIHLRKTDKLTEYGDIRHENTISEFELITNKLLEDIQQIILYEEYPVFLIVSEDEIWKNEIMAKILDISIKYNKNIKFLTPDYKNEKKYDNFRSVMDMFCLSKCKEILQGVKYSTFSMLAALLGNCKLRNYSRYTDSDELCLIYLWNSVLEINGKKNMDINLYEKLTSDVLWLETNIC